MQNPCQPGLLCQAGTIVLPSGPSGAKRRFLAELAIKNSGLIHVIVALPAG